MQAKNVPCGMEDPRDLLIDFRRYLGLSQEAMRRRYDISVRTLKHWESSVESSGPNLKTHVRLLCDLFR